MRILTKINLLLLSLLLFTVVNAQELTQIVPGQVVDAESQSPVAFASFAVITTNPPMGSTTDEDGYFRIENVPVGRHNFQVTCTSNETQLISEIQVSSGKEIVLTIKVK
jgi:hypothetical protein